MGETELLDRVRAAWTDVLDGPDSAGEESFVSAGGHSLAAARLVARLRGELGVEIPLSALLRDDPTFPQFAAMVAGRATEREMAPVETATPVETARPSELPLAPTMRRIWAWHRLYPDSPAYNVSRVLRVEGRLRPAALRAAVADLAERHEALRCSVPEPRPGEPRIRVGEPVPVPVSVQVVAGTPDDPMAGVDEALHQVGARPFLLDTAPLWRLGVVYASALQCSFVVLLMHHMISDLRSSDQVLRELARCYEARTGGGRHEFAEQAPSLLEHVEHELGLVGSPAWERDLAWWAEQLGEVGSAAAAPLPFAAADRDERIFAADTHTVDLDAADSAAITRALRTHGATPATFFLTAATAVVEAWAGGGAETVGIPSVRFHRPEDDRLVGFLLDTLPLRLAADRDTPFADACARTGEVYTDAADHAVPAFDEIVDRLRLPRATGARSPLIRLWFSDMTRADMPARFGDLPSREYDLPPAWSLFELGIYLRVDGDRYRLHLVVPRGRYRAADVAELPAQIARLAVRAAGDPARTLGELLAPVPEQVLAGALGTPQSVPEQVAAHARARPTAVALADVDGVLDYRTLDALVDREAALLPGGAVVALPARRDRTFVVRLLACRRAGVTAVLVDAAWPPRRRERAAVAATHAYPETGDGPAAPTGRGATVTEPGHVLFTSGTTGDPLPVRVSAVTADAALADLIGLLDVTATDRISFLSGPAHDPVLRDVGLALHAGATVCLPPTEVVADPRRVASWWRRERVTVVNATPALLGLALGAEEHPLPDLRIVVCGGSVLSTQTAALIRGCAPRAVVVNGYGCTETPQLVTAHVLPPRVAQSEPASRPNQGGESPEPGRPDTELPPTAHVPIGHPLPGRRIELRASDGGLCDVGQVGELWVAGPHLADGYLGADVHDRFTTDDTGTHWLRTGDRARRDASGAIHLAGRTDRQVLLGGHRVNLAEIENAARDCPGVVDALAQVVGESDDRGARVWAQHAPGRPLEPATVRAHLEALLPAASVPARVLVVDRLDLGVNLKPMAPAATVPESDPGEVDTALQRLAESMLGRPLDPAANFFDAGFTSVALVQLSAELGELLGRPVEALTVFQHPNLSALGAFLRGPRPLLTAPRAAGAGEARTRSRDLRREIRARVRGSAP